jgi:quinol monooxygenase YgiN
MGLRHIVTLTFRDDTTAEQVQAIADALGELPEQIPELRSYEVGVDAGLTEGNASMVLVADFDDAAGWEAYRDHPAHQAVITQQIVPVLTARSAVQHER